MATQRLRYVNTASAGGGDGTTNGTGAGGTNAYASLHACLLAEQADLTAADVYLDILCTGAEGTADIAGIPITDVDGFVTDATRYITITGDWNGTKLDSSKYILYDNNTAYIRWWFDVNYITISRIQFYMLSSESYAGVSTSTIDVVFNRCLFKGGGNNSQTGFWAKDTSADYNLYNCVFYNFTGTSSRAIYHNYRGGCSIYNCTFYNNTVGIYVDSGNDATSPVLKNNLFYSNVTNVTGGVNSASDYNATDDAAIGYSVYAPGAAAHDQLSRTFTFITTTDTTVGFLHLDPTDVGAKNLGVDLSAVFTVDVDGNTRPTGASSWDIGFSEQLNSSGSSSVITRLIVFKRSTKSLVSRSVIRRYSYKNL